MLSRAVALINSSASSDLLKKGFMTKLLLLSCLLLTVLYFGNRSQGVKYSSGSSDQCSDKYSEATSVKVGMTRADLIKLFEVDGGIQPILPSRYVLKSSNIIKVDVEFEVPENVKGRIIPEGLRNEMERSRDSQSKSYPKDYQFVPNEKLKIKSISKPYLESPFQD